LLDLHLDGVVTAYDSEEDIVYYYSESMALGDCIIKLDTVYPEDGANKIEYIIQVSLWDDENVNAYKFIFYWDKPPVPLMIRNMVQQIVEFQAVSCMEHFIEFCKDMSIQYICSGDQDTEQHEDDIIEDVNYDLHILGTNEAMEALAFMGEDDETPNS
jgi:hypothetical protein